MIVNEQRKKLSKRRDKLALAAYQVEGILPEAMANYLATLGWSPGGDDELATLDEMIPAFRLEDLSKAPAAFDLKKLHAFNGHYLRALPRDVFVERTLDWYRTTIVEPMAELIQERGATFPETLAMTDFFLHDAPPMDLTSWQKAMVKGADNARAVLGAAIAGFDAEDLDWTSADALKAVVEGIVESTGLKIQKVQEPIRVAVTGRTVGPPLWESLVVLGKHRTIERLVRALEKLPPPA
jgi:glutamyl-tRNA synthetase